MYNYSQPVPDQLAQLRQNQAQQPFNSQVANYMPQSQNAFVGQNTAQQAVSSGIIWVQGEEGAKASMVAPGNTVLLMDSDGSSFYLKSADASGMPQPLRIFDYQERINTPKTPLNTPKETKNDYVTRKEFNALEAKFDAIATQKETRAKKVEPKE